MLKETSDLSNWKSFNGQKRNVDRQKIALCKHLPSYLSACSANFAINTSSSLSAIALSSDGMD